jgi:hypothetical protein
LRILASARTSPRVFDLRCEVREKLVDFLQREHPEALPHTRQITSVVDTDAAADTAESRTARRR